jgi:hypothetical protein
VIGVFFVVGLINGAIGQLISIKFFDNDPLIGFAISMLLNILAIVAAKNWGLL